MKHFNYLIFTSLIFTTLLFFASCSPEDETPVPGAPVVTISGTGIDDNTFTGNVGETVNATINIEAPSGFNTLHIRKFVNDDEVTTAREEFARTPGTTPPTSETYNFTYVIEQGDVGNEVYWSFEAVDENNATTTERLDIEATTPPASRYTSVLLFAPLETGNSETFFSTNTGETYSMNDVNNSADPISENIDFGYFYGQTFQATLAAPSLYPLEDYGQANWTVRNSTRIGRTDITPGQYTEITEENVQAINDAFEAAEFGENENQVQNLQVGEILAFETDPNKPGGSKRGLIQVQSIVTGIGETGSIEIEVLAIQ